MASALAALKNASATFQVAQQGVITDPETGNVLAASAAVTVDLFLKAQNVDYTALPGIELVDTVYEGYALGTLPAGVVVGTHGELIFAGEDAVDCEVLELRLPYGGTGLLGATLAQALGERLRLVARGQG